MWRSVLRAIGITDGAMHSEVMATARGPVLVEVNCRLHGGEGIWLPIAEACLHYTQVSALHAATFAPEAYAALPATPRYPMHKHGAWVTIRSPAEGTITEVHQGKLERIRALPSFLGEYFAPCISVGSRVRQTVDATTVQSARASSNPRAQRGRRVPQHEGRPVALRRSGCFNLAHQDRQALEADYAVAQACRHRPAAAPAAATRRLRLLRALVILARAQGSASARRVCVHV